MMFSESPRIVFWKFLSLRVGFCFPLPISRPAFSFSLFYQKMGFWALLEGFLLIANALAILNEERFLAPRGWTLAEMTGPKKNSLKGQVIGLIYACQFLRLPLILFNVIIIIVKLFSG